MTVDNTSDDRNATREAMARFRMLLADAEATAEDMLQIGEAQRILIRHGDLSPDEALAQIFTRAARENISLGEASTRIVAETS